ncbi:hypothetical protein SFC42_21575 [Priestia filamentosa]|uniref:hypothetical protein n=1 Tax=Priestia filamentosa TaxID=1402861 RepID=UPI0039834146
MANIPLAELLADTADNKKALNVKGDFNFSASSVVNGKVKNVTTAGTKVRLDDIPSREVTVIARKGNTGSIYVGGSDVSSSVFGVELAANESYTFVVNNANAIYIDASVSGEGVSYVAL